MRKGGADGLAAESGAALQDTRAKLESKYGSRTLVAERPHPAIKRVTKIEIHMLGTFLDSASGAASS